MNPIKHKEFIERVTSTNQPSVQVEITISKGNQEIRLSPEEYSRLAKRMELSLSSQVIVINE